MGGNPVPRKFIEFSGDPASPPISGKEKSWICLCPFGALDKSVIAQKIACDFLSDLRFFFSAPAVENRKRFSTAGEGPFFLVLFLKEKGRIFSDSFRSRGKYRKKGEWKEKSWICLCPFGALNKSGIGAPANCVQFAGAPINDFFFPSKSERCFSRIRPDRRKKRGGQKKRSGPRVFLSTRSPPKIACDFRGLFFPSINGSLVPSNSFRIGGDDGFPPISLKSEETSKKIPPGAPIFDRALAFFYRPISWVGKKILRHAPANPFMRFARRAVNLRGPDIVKNIEMRGNARLP